jgi:DNA-3-methyladenine glycosylase
VTDRLARPFYDRDPREVAVDLLGKVFVRREVDGSPTAGRVVEVEAYLGLDDPGSHAFRGETPRVRTMFGPPGHLYVYFTYGMHWCANVVCGPGDTPGAVLLRALAPMAGHEAMRARRGAVAARDRDLCSGPAKLCQALDIGRALDGADLVTGEQGVWLVDDGAAPPAAVGNSTRVGLSQGAEHRWRWFVTGDQNVSRGPRVASGAGASGG